MLIRSDQIKGQKAHTIIIDEPIGYDAHVRAEILPEERAAVRGARKVLKKGPERIITDTSGHASHPTRTKENIKNIAYVFIRDDGWTVGCRKEHRSVTEESWRGDWVGRMEFVSPKAPGRWAGFCELYVYSRQGFEYKAGELNPEGFFVARGDVEVSGHEPEGALKPRTLEEMREWMRKGCPTNEE